jgi:hypothetical protein
MTQTELNLGKGSELEAPYNGLFFCHIRGGLFRWPEFISFFKQKRL